MGVRIDQNHNPVQLDQPGKTGSAHEAKSSRARRGARAGHLRGENLQIGKSNGGKVQTGGSQGIPKPVLNVPNQDPTVASFQAAMGSLDQLVAGEDTSPGGMKEMLKKAGKSNHEMKPGKGADNITVNMTETGFKGTVDGDEYSFDAKQKALTLNMEGQEVVFKSSGKEGMEAFVDGEPLITGDDEVGTMNHFFMLMALFHKMGVDQRQMSRQGRNAANELVVEKIKAQAQEQRNAAAAKLVAGCVSGAVKMASASLTMAGSMKGLKADQAAAQAGSTAHPGDMIAQQWSAMGKMFEGLGEAGSSTLQYKAGMHEAASTELRAEEEQARFIKQTEQDQMQVAQELSSKARDTFSQTWSQYLQTQQNITRNI